MEVVINSCFGGFGLSEEAERKLEKLLLEQPRDYVGTGSIEDPIRIKDKDVSFDETLLDKRNILQDILYTPVIFYRANKHLVRIVKEMGEKASKRYSNLKVIDIPEDAINPYISDYDGMEHVAEGRIWR